MKDPELVQRMLVREEGEVLHAYQDHLGYWTIGVGHLIDPRKQGSISRAASRFILAEDLAASIRAARNYYWFDSLDAVRQAVVLGMIHQLGPSGFDAFRATRAAIARSDWTAAASHMMRSRWARQTPARARRAADAMLTGEDQWRNES